MKRLLFLGFVLACLYGCSSQPPFVDNGKPGQVKVVVFYDDNKDGVMSGGEKGAQSKVSISQEVSCPPSHSPDWVDTDSAGVHTFQDLKPGKYCVISSGGLSATTPLTQEVYVSSERVTTATFGVLRP